MKTTVKAKVVLAWTLAGIGVLPSAAPAETPPAVDQAIQAAVEGPQRTTAFKLRDNARHPAQTLEFFGIRPDMAVVEVLPGGGWFTEILAPFLRDKGTLVEATPPVSSHGQFMQKAAETYAKKLAASPDVYGKVATTPFEAPEYMPLGAPASADMVLTFLNLHDFAYANVHKGVSDAVMDRFFTAAFQVLKPGGVLGVVEHRARSGQSVSDSMPLGRIPQDYVIREGAKAGFKLAASSEINANPKDDGSYPVWYLPPTLSLGQQDRARYAAVGESDDMTLLFAKPAE